VSDAALLDACEPTPEGVGRALGELVGWRLYTVMALDMARGEAARLHSSEPEAYPVGGRKPLGSLTEWGVHVIEGRRPWIARTAEELRAAFPDHETISALGCESCLNVPILDGPEILGTVNLLDRAHRYGEKEARRAAPFAALLASPLRRWAERREP
jgi:hypothetical protein